MFDHTKPARTKDGREARFLGRIENEEYPLVFALKDEENEVVDAYTINGEYNSLGLANGEDLENIPEKHVFYLNINKDSKACVLRGSRNQSDKDAGKNRIACIRVEFEDGQFDE